MAKAASDVRKKQGMINREQHIKSVLSVLMVTILCVAAVSCLAWVYLHNLKTMMKSDTMSYLKEISNHMRINVENMIEVNHQILGTVYSSFEEKKSLTNEEAVQAVKREHDRWNFSTVGVVDENGSWLNETGIWSYLGAEDYIQQAMVNREPSMSDTVSIHGKDSIVFMIPGSEVEVDGHKVIGIAGVYDLELLNDVLNLHAFDGKAYAHIINKDGTLAVRSTSQVNTYEGYNLFQTLLHETFDEGSTLEQFTDDVANRRSGIIGYTLDGIHRYTSYIPINHSEWYLLSVVPSSVVDEKSEAFFRFTAMICVLIIISFSLILLTVSVQRFRNQHKLERTLYVDTVTEGNTQAYFEAAASMLLRQHSYPCAVVFVNIDKFKLINEREGRAGGDHLLKTLYWALDGVLLPNEIMCRLTVDHFALFVKCEDEEELRQKLKRSAPTILDRLHEELTQYREGSFSISFGAYQRMGDEQDLTVMLDRANIALKSAKREVVAPQIYFSLYDDEIRQKMLREKELEDCMYEALRNHEFVVYLQPKMGLHNRCVAGAEALARWQQKSGMVYPNEFIPLFEKNGFITKLDFYIFREVYALLTRWMEEGKNLVPVSVNISRVNLDIPDFFEPYEEIIREGKVPPNMLEFEFTETMAYNDIQVLDTVIERIHSIGSSCSMDDFGSSYSSLNLLKDINIDVIKLDGTFFRNYKHSDGRDMDIVEGIIALARKLGLGTVAEGVEIEEQVSFLKGIHCDMVQGYIFAKPMPVDQYEKLMTTNAVT